MKSIISAGVRGTSKAKHRTNMTILLIILFGLIGTIVIGSVYSAEAGFGDSDEEDLPDNTERVGFLTYMLIFLVLAVFLFIVIFQFNIID